MEVDHSPALLPPVCVSVLGRTRHLQGQVAHQHRLCGQHEVMGGEERRGEGEEREGGGGGGRERERET